MNTDNILDGLQKPTWTYGNQDDWEKLQKSRDAWRADAERLEHSLTDLMLIVEKHGDMVILAHATYFLKMRGSIELHRKLESEEK